MRKNQSGGVVLWTIGILVVLFVVLPLLGLAFGIITLPFQKAQSKVNLNHGVIAKTYDTDYCLNNYDWFKSTYNDIQQTDTKVSNLNDELDTFTKTAGQDSSKWSFTQQQEYDNIMTDLTGAKNYKADLVGQYNARSEQLENNACKDLPLFVKP